MSLGWSVRRASQGDSSFGTEVTEQVARPPPPSHRPTVLQVAVPRWKGTLRHEGIVATLSLITNADRNITRLLTQRAVPYCVLTIVPHALYCANHHQA